LVLVGTGVLVAVLVGVFVAACDVFVAVGVVVFVGTGVLVAVLVRVGVAVLVFVGAGVLVGVLVRVAVAVFVAVFVGVTGEPQVTDEFTNVIEKSTLFSSNRAEPRKISFGSPRGSSMSGLVPFATHVKEMVSSVPVSERDCAKQPVTTCGSWSGSAQFPAGVQRPRVTLTTSRMLLSYDSSLS